MSHEAHQRAVDLSQLGGLANALSGSEVSPLIATWQFPARPLVELRKDGALLAAVDYSLASASNRWSLVPAHPALTFEPIGLTALASQVPEDVDTDEGLQVYVLDSCLEALTDAANARPSSDPRTL